MRFKAVFWCCSFGLIAFSLQAQDSGEENYRLIGGSLNVGSIFAHSADVENTAGSIPFGFELEWARRRLEEKTWETCHCYPVTGFLAGYTNFDNRVLGHSVHAAYFVEHRFLPFEQWSPTLRGAAGLIYASRPYNAESNPENQSYSLPVSVFLQLQAGVTATVFERHIVSLRLGYNHLSNGGIREPNKGVNWPHVTVGYAYRMQQVDPPKREKHPLRQGEQRWIRRFHLLGAYTTRVFEEREEFLAVGAMATMAYKISGLHTITGAAEWHYHQEHQRRIERSDESVSAHRAGLLVGHEFLLGRVVFSQQIGVYVFDQFRYHDPLYHRWGVGYVHRTGLSFGISLKAHRHVAEFVDVRVGFNW